jgi:hypothetical protein
MEVEYSQRSILVDILQRFTFSRVGLRIFARRKNCTLEAKMRAVGFALSIVCFTMFGTVYGQSRPKSQLLPRVPKDPLDLGAVINAQIAALPTIGGFKAGRIDILPGVYFQSTTVVINSPSISIVGAGSGAVQITCTMDAVCWDLRLNPFVVTQAGGQLSGFTLLGMPANSNAVGIHMGDIIGTRLEDIDIEGFKGTNAVGMWWDNLNGWTERVNVQRVNLTTNTTNYKFTNSGGPQSTSFCYNQWLDLRMNVGQGQKGIDFQSGNLCGSTMMMVVNGAGTNKTYINITGPSAWHDNVYDIKVEDDGGGGTRLATAPGTVFDGVGMVTTIQGALSDSIGGTFSLFLPYTIGASYTKTTSPTRWFTDQFGNLQVEATLAATPDNNFSSPLVSLKSACWNGSATGVDAWQFQNVVSSGANPASVFQFSFTPYGCTAIPEFQVVDGIGNGLLLSTPASGVSPRFRHDASDNLVIDTGGSNASLFLNTDNNRPVKLGTGGTTGANIPIVATLTTNGGSSSDLSMPGVTGSSHCSLTPTNLIAANNAGTTFVSAKTADQITVMHSPMTGMSFDVLCTPN